MAMTGFDLFVLIMAGVTVVGALAVIGVALGWGYRQSVKAQRRLRH